MRTGDAALLRPKVSSCCELICNSSQCSLARLASQRTITKLPPQHLPMCTAHRQLAVQWTESTLAGYQQLSEVSVALHPVSLQLVQGCLHLCCHINCCYQTATTPHRPFSSAPLPVAVTMQQHAQQIHCSCFICCCPCLHQAHCYGHRYWVLCF